MKDIRPAEVFPPGEFIREELEERGWTQADLAGIMGRTVAMVNEIITGRRGITQRTAEELGAAFGTGPELWINLQASYRRADSAPAARAVSDMATLYEIAPIREMMRRKWIRTVSTPDELRAELCQFFGVDVLDNLPQKAIAARKSEDTDRLTPAQKAWYYRARNIAKHLRVVRFDKSKLGETQKRLRALAEYAPEARKVSQILGEYGIRFLVVEHLPASKIDGATFWLDQDSQDSPVVAISLRFARIDNFWFTLMHEFCHLKRHDAILDPGLFGTGGSQASTVEETERLVDESASEMLIPKKVLESFILRVSPFFSKTKIIQFALRNKVHPGIVVGQLQHGRHIGYQDDREMLVPVRDIVADASVTDGWKRILNVK